MLNYRLSKLLTLENTKEYIEGFKLVKPKNRIWIFKARDIWKMSFEDVEVLKKKQAAAQVIDTFRLIFGIEIFYMPPLVRSYMSKLVKRRPNTIFLPMPSWLVLRLRATTFFPCLNHIKNELEDLIEKEKLLAQIQQTDPDMIKAGSEKMAIFGIMNILIPAASKYGLFPEDAIKWSYYWVMTETKIDATRGAVMDEYYEIKRKKQS